MQGKQGVVFNCAVVMEKGDPELFIISRDRVIKYLK